MSVIVAFEKTETRRLCQAGHAIWNAQFQHGNGKHRANFASREFKLGADLGIGMAIGATTQAGKLGSREWEKASIVSEIHCIALPCWFSPPLANEQRGVAKCQPRTQPY
ncbi:hypothetical protein PZ897_06360 [Hoeflea sp. YIM 152468]|uniref:hypothetical protein n=1 Tax=Hoeflea sp. YIM 152468 TaxID=3031759 RepID=UPI0023DA69EF|nr:hypothetical protein [Hoeflea sp. YIM 152468]MDF1607795.1 hypothetical protein [Hoeflea sp. YIM 152468]